MAIDAGEAGPSKGPFVESEYFAGALQPLKRRAMAGAVATFALVVIAVVLGAFALHHLGRG